MKRSEGWLIILEILKPESVGSEGIGTALEVYGYGRVVEMSTSSILSLFSVISERYGSGSGSISGVFSDVIVTGPDFSCFI